MHKKTKRQKRDSKHDLFYKVMLVIERMKLANDFEATLTREDHMVLDHVRRTAPETMQQIMQEYIEWKFEGGGPEHGLPDFFYLISAGRSYLAEQRRTQGESGMACAPSVDVGAVVNNCPNPELQPNPGA